MNFFIVFFLNGKEENEEFNPPCVLLILCPSGAFLGSLQSPFPLLPKPKKRKRILVHFVNGHTSSNTLKPLNSYH